MLTAPLAFLLNKLCVIEQLKICIGNQREFTVWIHIKSINVCRWGKKKVILVMVWAEQTNILQNSPFNVKQ